jgi:hypothetical protein
LYIFILFYYFYIFLRKNLGATLDILKVLSKIKYSKITRQDVSLKCVSSSLAAVKSQKNNVHTYMVSPPCVYVYVPSYDYHNRYGNHTYNTRIYNDWWVDLLKDRFWNAIEVPL